MKAWTFLFLSAAFAASALSAEPLFRFYVFDRTQTDSLDLERVQELKVEELEPNNLGLTYYCIDKVLGLNQDSFTLSSERYLGKIDQQTLTGIITEARKLPTGQLASGRRKLTSGELILDKRKVTIHAEPDNADRLVWKEFLEKLVAAQAPAGRLSQESKTVEGDTVAARQVAFSDLLANPAAYDGKRIRLTGYYQETKFSSPSNPRIKSQTGFPSLSPTKNEMESRGRVVRIGVPSTFARLRNTFGSIGRYQSMEGTFYAQNSGMAVGQLNQITKAEAANPP